MFFKKIYNKKYSRIQGKDKIKSALDLLSDNFKIKEYEFYVQEKIYGGLQYINQLHKDSFPSFVRLCNFAFNMDCLNILEIGAGVSTAVWAFYSKKTGASVTTIDADLTRVRSYLKNTPYIEWLNEFIKLKEGLTCNAHDMKTFYLNSEHKIFNDIPVEKIAYYVDYFQNPTGSKLQWNNISKLTDRNKWIIKDVFFKKNKLIFPRAIIDNYSYAKNFDNELAQIKDYEDKFQKILLDELISNDTKWDLVFFDSGELSSTIDWLKINKQIPVGGFVALHDIFFPKSIKNFLICASIMADPHWKILFIDDKTPQGLMIAQRVNYKEGINCES